MAGLNQVGGDFHRTSFDLDILTLPDFETIPAYKKSLNTDEAGVAVEIGQKNIYRFYSYPTPEIRVQKFPEAKKIVGILNLVAKEFALKEF